MKILLVEDDPASLLMLTKALQRRGHQVIGTANGEEALRLLDRESFQVVISDWIMPKLDGLQLCRILRASEQNTYTYYLMLTAADQHKDRLMALEEGADDMMVKPFHLSELNARLRVAERILAMNEEVQRKSVEMEQLSNVLQFSNRRISEMFKGLPIPCVTISQDGSVMEWNTAAENLFHLKSYEVYMQPLWTVITSPRYKRQAEELTWAAVSGEDIKEEDWTCPLKSGKKVHLLVSTFPIRNHLNEVVGSVLAYVDVTKQKQLEHQIKEQLQVARSLSNELQEKNTDLKRLTDQLEELASTDGLTGLPNYRTFKEKLEFELKEVVHHGRPLSIILTDIDKFKTFNDDFGHLVGDEVLRKVSSVFKTLIAEVPAGIVARYGGEEFVVVLPNSTESQATEFAEKLRLGVEQEKWPWRQVTSSFGVATWDSSIVDVKQFVDLADKALYFSKENGRNQVNHFKTLPAQAA
ncbi:MAG: diguanylate cyclase [Armatimonadetes bacterium]|nr:diguanylate cyclase [Armatimonadota bacterium]